MKTKKTERIDGDRRRVKRVRLPRRRRRDVRTSAASGEEPGRARRPPRRRALPDPGEHRAEPLEMDLERRAVASRRSGRDLGAAAEREPRSEGQKPPGPKRKRGARRPGDRRRRASRKRTPAARATNGQPLDLRRAAPRRASRRAAAPAAVLRPAPRRTATASVSKRRSAGSALPAISKTVRREIPSAAVTAAAATMRPGAVTETAEDAGQSDGAAPRGGAETSRPRPSTEGARAGAIVANA